MFRIGDGLADVDVFETGDRDDIAHLRVIRFHARQTVVRVQTADFILAHLIAVHDRDRLTVTDETAHDTTDGDFADVIIVIQRRDHDLQRRFHVAFRRRNVIQKRLKKRLPFDFLDALIRTVNLVDDDDRLQILLQGFAQHVLRLRHRPFKSVDQ